MVEALVELVTATVMLTQDTLHATLGAAPEIVAELQAAPLVESVDLAELQGLRGPPGPVGPPGPEGGGANYLHVQGVPEAVWQVVHGLGRFPAVTVLDSTGAEVEGEVQHVSTNELVLVFSGGFSGRCVCT